MCIVTIKSREISWGVKAQGPSTPPPPPMHHFSHRSLAALSLEMSSSPPSGIVAMLYGGPPFLL